MYLYHLWMNVCVYKNKRIMLWTIQAETFFWLFFFLLFESGFRWLSSIFVFIEQVKQCMSSFSALFIFNSLVFVCFITKKKRLTRNSYKAKQKKRDKILILSTKSNLCHIWLKQFNIQWTGKYEWSMYKFIITRTNQV